MKCACFVRLRCLGFLIVLAVACACTAQSQNPFVTEANWPCGPIPPCLNLPPQTVQNASFQNIFVYIPAAPGETWDDHLHNFMKAQPMFGPPTTGSLPFVNCMDGTASPCLQDLTSEAIDNFVQALVTSDYFQPWKTA